jgi:hypothetical protein
MKRVCVVLMMVLVGSSDGQERISCKAKMQGGEKRLLYCSVIIQPRERDRVSSARTRAAFSRYPVHCRPAPNRSSHEPSRWSKVWKISAVILVAANAADVQSSWGRPELNPLLGRGRFGTRAVSIKAAVTGGALLGEWLILRRSPRLTPLVTVGNLGAAAATGSVVWRNHRMVAAGRRVRP